MPAHMTQMLDIEEQCLVLKVCYEESLPYFLLIFIVDDMFLTTKLWTSPDPTGNYRVVPSDLEGHIPWMASINSRLPAGSNYTIELGHNGNGNIGVCNCCVLPCLNTTYVHPRAEIDTSPNGATVSAFCP